MLTNVLVNAKYLEQPMQLDWPFDSGRKKTYLSQERGQRTPKYSDRLWMEEESGVVVQSGGENIRSNLRGNIDLNIEQLTFRMLIPSFNIWN